VLVGRIAVEEALQSSAEHENLQILAAGRIPPNPSELLGSKAMHALVDRLAETALVVLDAPPLLPVTDAAVLTANADGALVVITAGKTVDAELGTALSHLEAVNGRALGVILNKTPRRGSGSYYGDYYGSYTSAAPDKSASASKPGRRKRRANAKAEAPRPQPSPTGVSQS
jgi:capsular exopolysaccharide synthesis family protein